MKFSVNDNQNLSIVEKLIILEEECIEVAEVCLKTAKLTSKILRFGIDNKNPSNHRQNKAELENELGDLLEMIDQITNLCELDKNSIQAAKVKKRESLVKWSINKTA